MFSIFVLQGFLRLISIIHQAVFATIMPVILVHVFPISICPNESLSDFLKNVTTFSQILQLILISA
jgi:hypothetical protein